MMPALSIFPKASISLSWFIGKALPAFVLVLLFAHTGGAASEYMCGDANSDNQIDVADVVQIINHIFREGDISGSVQAADANCDGAINVADCVFLLAHIFRDGPPPCFSCPPIEQNILFEVCYSNAAWGLTLQGFYVDNQGNAYSYSYDPGDIFWPFPVWNDTLTEFELMYRYGHNPELATTIPHAVLYQYYSLIQSAAEGELSYVMTTCFDFGIIYYVAYIFDDGIQEYIPVLLHQAGDISQKNYAEEAEILFEWLQTIAYGNPPCQFIEP